MGSILFIHGMGHDTNEDYWRAWGAKLLPYLVARGIKPETIYFGGIYYYDLVPQPGDGWKKVTAFISQDFLKQIKRDLWEHIVRGGDATELLGRGPIDGFVNLIADNFGDIFSYLLDDEVYLKVNNRFFETLQQTSGPITLIAYSLGSMISFCALQQNHAAAQKVTHFITLGSPIFWFRKWLSSRTQLVKRPTAAHWTNLAGKIDVACPHLVGYQTCSPDMNIECQLEKYNPVKGHLAYFSEPQALTELAKIIAKGWS